MDISIIVPVRNEQEILREAMVSLAAPFDQLFGAGRWEMILVDNNSTDNSSDIIEDLTAEFSAMKSTFILEPSYSSALRGGLAAAKGQWLAICDVDFWDHPFLEWAWNNRTRFDLFLGSKRCDPTLNELSKYRRLLSWGLNALLDLFFDFPGRDTHGPKVMNASKMRPIIDQCISEKGQFDTEFTLRALRKGLLVCEVPVPVRELRKRRNFMIRKVFWNLKALLRLRRVIQAISYENGVRYYRFSRKELEEAQMESRS